MIEGVLCMNIKNIVTKLIKKYGTNDPFQIAKQELKFSAECSTDSADP